MLNKLHNLVITTPRLLLRSPMMTDLEIFHKAKIEIWEDLQQSMLWASDEEYSIDATRHFISEDLNHIRHPLLGFNRENGEFVVATGIDRVSLDIYATGYWVAQKYRRQGYATESCNAMIRLCFAALDPLGLCIDHFEGNTASQAIIQNLGFTPVDIVLKSTKRHKDGQMVDLHRYVRTDMHDLPELDVSGARLLANKNYRLSSNTTGT